MIEVLSSFNCATNTFFVAVDIMDAFFARAPRTLETKDVHLIGVTAMLLASKQEEIVPFKVSTVVEKMTHNKLRSREVVDCETEMLFALGFNPLTTPSLFIVVEALLLKLGFQSGELSGDILKVVTYIAKMLVHDYSVINRFPLRYIAASCLYICFKIVEQVHKDFKTKQFVEKVKAVLELDDTFFYKASEVVLHLAKSFESAFPFAKNLQKFDAFTLDDRAKSRAI